MCGCDFIRQLLATRVHCVKLAHVLKVLDHVVELLPDLNEFVHRVHETVVCYVYHLEEKPGKNLAKVI